MQQIFHNHGGQNRMKIYIATDMEGISGIHNSNQVTPGEVNYGEGRKYLTEEINACVEGCFRGGATEVIVSDSHYGGANVIWHELDGRASYRIGHHENKPDPTGRLPGIEGCDGLILLGYHAMAGTAGAMLRHTMNSADWHNFYVNGKASGEIVWDAGLAAEYGVPVIMASGDDKLCAEALDFFPGIVTACVKQGFARFGGILLSKDAARKLITDKSAEAVRRCKEFKPIEFTLPVTLRLENTERTKAYNNTNKPYMTIIDDRTFEVTGGSFSEAVYRLLNA